jgi:orotate phosphoribosyltransferase
MIIAIVDRGGTCRAMAKQAELKFFPLLTARDLGFDYEGP